MFFYQSLCMLVALTSFGTGHLVEKSAKLVFPVPANICRDAHNVHVSTNSSPLRDAKKYKKKWSRMRGKRTDTLQDLDSQTGQKGCIEYDQNARV